jgi:hypothetical protein
MPETVNFFTVKVIGEEVIIAAYHKAKVSCCLSLTLEESQSLAEELHRANTELESTLRLCRAEGE